MPYSKGYKRRNRRYKRKGGFFRKARKFVQGATSALGVAYSAYRLAKRANSLLNVEYKSVDTAANGPFTTAPAISLLSNTIQGTGVSNRTGNSIKLKSLHDKMILQVNSAATTHNVARIILFIDKDSRGSAPTGADLLVSTTDINSPINLFNGKRFIVLFDKHYTVSPATSGQSAFTINYFKKFNMDITYQASGGSVADSDTNNIYLCTLCSSATNPPTLAYYSRLRFIDN